MGFIYIISNNINGKQYVGQTCNTIENRFAEHKYASLHYKKYLENPEKYAYKGTCTYLYRAMEKYGFDAFSIDILIEVDNSELDENEILYIQEFGTLAPHGYNLTTGGGHFQHCEMTRKIISKKVQKTMLDNIDNFRTSDKTKGMPPYVAYKIHKGYEAYYVNNHPLCKRKYFSSHAYETIDVARQKCIEFVNELNINGEKYTPLGPNGSPAKGLRPLQYGYQVRRTINGMIVEKSFNDKQLSKEENLKNANEFIQSLM